MIEYMWLPLLIPYLTYSGFYFVTINNISDQSATAIIILPLFVFYLANAILKFSTLKQNLDAFTIGIATLCIYIFFRSLTDTGNIVPFRNFVLNTSSSILFGCFLASLATKVYKVIRIETNDAVKKLSKRFGILQFVSLLLILFTLAVSFENLQENVFYTKESGNYQRPGDLTIVYSILNYCMFYAIQDRIGGIKLITRMMLLFNSLLLVVYMQLIGSNAATLVLLLLISYNGIRFIKRKIFVRNPLLAVRILFLIVLISVPGYLLGAILIENIDQIRFFGFNKIEENSLISRLNILTENSKTHFLYAPFWGHVNVDVVTSTDGAFIHSIFSVFLHLGIIGLILIMYFIMKSFLDIGRIRKYIGLSNSANFLSFLLCIVLIISIGFTFFTWTVLWFTLTLINNIGKIEVYYGNKYDKRKTN